MHVRYPSLFVNKVAVSSNESIANQLRGYLRGQWVLINGMTARVANHTGSFVALWMQEDKMLAVWS